MVELCQIKIELIENVCAATRAGHGKLRDGDEPFLCPHSVFLGLLRHKGCKSILVVLEDIAVVLFGFDFLDDCFSNVLLVFYFQSRRLFLLHL